jgi:hypothetical protein
MTTPAPVVTGSWSPSNAQSPADHADNGLPGHGRTRVGACQHPSAAKATKIDGDEEITNGQRVQDRSTSLMVGVRGKSVP